MARTLTPSPPASAALETVNLFEEPTLGQTQSQLPAYVDSSDLYYHHMKGTVVAPIPQAVKLRRQELCIWPLIELESTGLSPDCML